jgi:hypothetical protein
MLADFDKAMKVAAATMDTIASLWFLALTKYSTRKIANPNTETKARRLALPTKP